METRMKFHFESDTFGGHDLHKCRRCAFLSLSVDDMKRHSVAVHSVRAKDATAAEALLTCPACPDQFFTADFFTSHLYYHHRATPADSELLLALFVDICRRRNPLPPLPEATEPSPPREKERASKYDFGYRCAVRDCGARLNLPESVRYHSKCHLDGAKELFCPECERRFGNLETLHNHLWKEHRIDVELHKCDKCPYRAYSLSRLNNTHKKIHSDEKNYRCDACSKAFKNGKQLANHRTRHKKNEGLSKKYPCDVCKMELSTPNHLEAHKKNVHEKVKLFACEQCRYSSYTKNSLMLHVRSHTGEKPYQCSECGSKFSNKSTLRRHLMLHTERKPYKCDRCSYGCIQASTIKAHVRLKHPGLETALLRACSFCSYSSVSEKNYNAHLATHKHQSVISVKSMVDLNGPEPEKTPKISVKSNLALKGSDDRRRSVTCAPSECDPDRSDVSSLFVDRTVAIGSSASTEIPLFDGRSPYSAFDDHSDLSFVVPGEFLAPAYADGESDAYSDGGYSEAFPKRESESNLREFGPPGGERDDASCDIKSSFFSNYA